MLKSELQKKLDEANSNLAVGSADYKTLQSLHKDQSEAIDALMSERDYMRDQMKRISQSLYAMIQVKYPEQYTCEPAELIDQGEEHRFLLFLHNLCVDRGMAGAIGGEALRQRNW